MPRLVIVIEELPTALRATARAGLSAWPVDVRYPGLGNQAVTARE